MVTHNGAAKGGTRNQVTFMLPPELRIELERELEEINETKAWGRTTLAEHCRSILSAHVAAKRLRITKVTVSGGTPYKGAAAKRTAKARARR